MNNCITKQVFSQIWNLDSLCSCPGREIWMKKKYSSFYIYIYIYIFSLLFWLACWYNSSQSWLSVVLVIEFLRWLLHRLHAMWKMLGHCFWERHWNSVWYLSSKMILRMSKWQRFREKTFWLKNMLSPIYLLSKNIKILKL